jgi:hypothetical protein
MFEELVLTGLSSPLPRLTKWCGVDVSVLSERAMPHFEGEFLPIYSETMW